MQVFLWKVSMAFSIKAFSLSSARERDLFLFTYIQGWDTTMPNILNLFRTSFSKLVYKSSRYLLMENCWLPLYVHTNNCCHISWNYFIKMETLSLNWLRFSWMDFIKSYRSNRWGCRALQPVHCRIFSICSSSSSISWHSFSLRERRHLPPEHGRCLE